MVKPLPILMEMPSHVKERILQYSDIKSRMSLRNVSRAARSLVDTSKHFIDTLELQFSHQQGVDVLVGPDTVLHFDSCHVAIRHLSIILANRKLRCRFLHVEVDSSTLALFTSLEHLLLKVDELHLNLMSSCQNPEDVLRAFHPGTLKIIDIRGDSDDVTLDEVFETEQWRRAQKVNVSTCQRARFSLEKWAHFNEFSVDVREVSTDLVHQLVQHTKNFKGKCSFRCFGKLKGANDMEKHFQSISTRIEESSLAVNYCIDGNVTVCISRPFGFILFVK